MMEEMYPQFGSQVEDGPNLFQLVTQWDDESAAVHYARRLLDHGESVNNRNETNSTPLHLAAEQGHSQLVRLFLDEYHADVHAEDENGATPIHLVCYCEDKEKALNCASLLLKYGASVNIKNDIDITPLHAALFCGNSQVLRLYVGEHDACVNDDDPLLHWLAYWEDEGEAVDCARLILEHGASVNGKNFSGETPLHTAIDYERSRLVHLYVDEYHCDVNNYHYNGNTLIQKLASWINTDKAVECMRSLIEHGASVNTENKYGQTALHLAIELGQSEMTRLYVSDFHADVNAQNEEGLTALQLISNWANEDEGVNLAKLFLQHDACVNARDNSGRTPLHLAAKHGRSQLMQLYISTCKADINIWDWKGVSPMHLIADCKDMAKALECARFLLHNGANLNAANNDGDTSLHLAVDRENLQLVRLYLQENNVDVNSQNNEGFTPLHIASQCENEETAIECSRLLVQHGALVNARDNWNMTPLNWAIKKEKAKLVHLLVTENDAHVNSQDNSGSIPLHLLVLWKDKVQALECSRLLVQYGALVNVQDKNGWTPLHLAAKTGRPHFVRLYIEEFHAHVNSKDKDGHTPLQLAVLYNKRDVAVECSRLLVQNFALVNARNNIDRTALHFAVKKGFFLLACLFINKYHADVNYRDRNGCTPLHWTVLCEDENYALECSSLLLRHGAFVNARDNNGRTPLQWATQHRRSQLMRLYVNDYHANKMLSNGEL